MCKKTVRVVLHVQSPAAAEVSPSAKLAPNKKQLAMQAAFCLVRAWGLEPQRIAAREPKSRMSTNSIMPANMSGRYILPLFMIQNLC